MIEQGRHPGDALQLLLDERLSAEEHATVEAHLLGCGRCRRELEALRRVKRVVREVLPERPVPPELSARVSTLLATEPIGGEPQSRRIPQRRRAAVLGLALAAAAVLFIVVARPDRQDMATAAAAHLTSYAAARLALEIETGDPQALERFFGERRLTFSIRVFDFGMMGYRLRGGRVHRIAGRTSALFAYEGRGGERVLCQMFHGAIAELPPAAEEREHDGIRFRIYRSPGHTLVFWQEGPIVCVLASDGDPEEAVQLAYAKAVKV